MQTIVRIILNISSGKDTIFLGVIVISPPLLLPLHAGRFPRRLPIAQTKGATESVCFFLC